MLLAGAKNSPIRFGQANSHSNASSILFFNFYFIVIKKLS
jgi:hypothetical protein